MQTAPPKECPFGHATRERVIRLEADSMMQTSTLAELRADVKQILTTTMENRRVDGKEAEKRLTNLESRVKILIAVTGAVGTAVLGLAVKIVVS